MPGLTFNLWHGQQRGRRQATDTVSNAEPKYMKKTPKRAIILENFETREEKLAAMVEQMLVNSTVTGEERQRLVADIIRRGKESSGATRYDADRYGNIYVTEPQHIDGLKNLGYPIVQNPGPDQVLLWHHNDNRSDPYYAAYLQAMSLR